MKKSKPEPAPKMDEKLKLSFNDFVAYMPMHNYIWLPTREPWPASSVDSQLDPKALLDSRGRPVLDKKGNPKIIPAHMWLDKNHAVHQMTWAPAEEMLVYDKVVVEGGWIDKPGAVCLNLYRPPIVATGTPARPSAGSTTFAGYTPTMPIISSSGWRIACSTPATRSITR